MGRGGGLKGMPLGMRARCVGGNGGEEGASGKRY